MEHLEYDRPLLAPLLAFSSFCPYAAVRPVPLYVSCVSAYLASSIERRRHYPSETKRLNTEHAPRVDARAEGQTVGLGGWLPKRDGDGRISKWLSPWYAFELTETTAPWAYCRAGEPYRTIAALEASIQNAAFTWT